MKLTTGFAKSLYNPNTTESNLNVRIVYYHTGKTLFEGTMDSLPRWEDIKEQYEIVEIRRSRILQKEKPLYERNIIITVI